MRKAKSMHRAFKAKEKAESKFLDNAMTAKDAHSAIKKRHEKKAAISISPTQAKSLLDKTKTTAILGGTFGAGYGARKLVEKHEKKANIYLERIALQKKAEETMSNKYLTKIAAEKWIQGAIKHPGALHKKLGVPKGEKIPEAKLEAAAHKPGKLGQEARLAETLKGFHHKKAGAYEDYMENAKGKKPLPGQQGFIPLSIQEKVAAALEEMKEKKKEEECREEGEKEGKKEGKKEEKEEEEEEQEKKAGILSTALGAAKNFGRAAAADASKIGPQLGNVNAAYRANKGFFNKGTMSTVKALGKNKAIQTGAGLVGAGALAGHALSRGQNKQAEENKYLNKLAGTFGGFSLPKPPMPVLGTQTLGIRG